MAENIAFSDWSEKLDTAGTNHWLPAYGLQQPTVIGSGSGGHRHLHHGQQNDHITFDSVDQADYYNGDDDDNNDDDLGEGDDDSWSSFNQSNYGGNIGRSTSYIFLETILEETSDDLRTDSERSSEEDFIKEDNWTAPNRDPFNLFNNKAVALAVYDNNDPGVHDDDDNVFFRSNFQDQQGWPTTVNAGGGSLLQFENLEKQCEQTVFRTTATSAPFMTNSAESLNGQRTTSAVSSRRHSWKHQQQNDDCDEYDEDETTLCSTPFSSYGAGDGSSVKSLSKSMESVHSAASKKRKRDSIVMDVTQSLEDLRRDDEQYDAVNSPVGTGMYKTVDCLIDPATFRKQNMVDATDGCKKAEELAAVGKQQRSSENLSEDSGFGDQVPRGPAVHQTYKPIAEDENYFEMSTKSILANAAAAAATEDCGDGRDVAALGPEKGTGGDNVDSLYDTKSKFSPAWRSYPDLGERSSVNPDSDTDDDHDHGSMASRLPMSSTPNLCSGDLDVTTGDYLRSKKFIDSTVSLNRSHSLKRIYYESESALSATSSRGSNLLMTTSFVNLAVPPSTNKGVHFCPVVSEVNWRESFSSTTDEVVSSAPETEEEENEAEDDNIDTMVMKLLTGLSSGTKQPSLAEKQQLRERLDFITGGSPPVSHRIGGGGAPTTTTGSTAAVAVDGGGNNNRSAQSRANDIDSSTVTMSKSKSIGGKLGGFFQRFSLRRLSGRRSKDKKKTKSDSETVSAAAPALSRPDTPPPPPPASSRQPVVGAVSKAATAVDRGKKPPLPPHAPVATAGDGFTTRRRLVYEENRGGRLPPPPPLPSAGSRASLQSRSPAAVMSRPDRRAGLLETDLDSNVTRTSSSSLTIGGGCSPNKKARSLLDLGASSGKLSLAPTDLSRQPVEASPSAEYRAKSMEFLLDKENQAAVQVPENELRKGTVNRGERMLSEHELRIQRSLQRLNLPEWYKTNHVPAQGFLLKRHSDAGHTTSMSSLSSTQSQSPKAHSNHNNSSLLSPQTHAATKNFSRWSTSRLNGGTHSNSTSPCSSTRSSFNYRQPYLGWRSQEKLSKPRTPAERLAAGLLAQQHHEQTSQANLSEVQSSIKEVTSAIANYVSSSSPDGSKERLNTDYHDTSSRCPSLRGSTGRLCWLESSFVGNKRPSLTRDTPPSENRTPPQPYKTTVPTKPTQKASGWVNDRPSPGSTTMEDVLNSLLGLQVPNNINNNNTFRYHRRRSSGNTMNRSQPYAASGMSDIFR
ncbi:uncharacterized protein LOC126836246 isoform X2 [Adelges cooleyi]|uniref:uncharacterized protein LOC126836246 isoform X2 n=1 Tax=Adelges cooleyi TaxID=133065 RepID=UPI002180514C|nr:uncharacterized protein LOC126836246 isoform X2 [Adelges cooleyi]